MFAVNSETWTTVGIVVGSGIAAATFVAKYGRGWLNGIRNRRRREDQFNGWVDDRNRWHPGVGHLVFGYEDDQGAFHEGLPAQVRTLTIRVRRLERQAGLGDVPGLPSDEL